MSGCAGGCGCGGTCGPTNSPRLQAVRGGANVARRRLDPYALTHESVAGAIGPELTQRARVRGLAGHHLVADAQLIGRPRYGPSRLAGRDVRSPQQFVPHPVITHALDTASVGIEGSGALPGRQLPGGWDGEDGFTSPHADDGTA